MPALSIARANSILVRNKMINTYVRQQLLKQMKVKSNKCIKIKKKFNK